ncbi:MAG: hypothetical protein AB7F43_04870 [Bacteriovoracia bacterium]
MKLVRTIGAHAPKLVGKPKLAPKNCNICNDSFKPRTVFDRFCSTCKEESELLKFSCCFPELDETILERIYA